MFWICTYHKRHLEPSGHSAGGDIECWPGVYYNYRTKVWEIDSSELACPGLHENSTDDEMEACGQGWEWVETLPEGEVYS